MADSDTKSKQRDRPRKVDSYEEFILWMALPTPEKMKLGIETRQAFAEYHKVGLRSLFRWQDRAEFKDRVQELRKKWAFEKTQGVIEGIYRSAVKGNDKSQKLWMQIFEGFTEKTEDTKTLKVEISVNDIRFLIEQMPSEYQERFYGYLREISDTAQSLRYSGRLEDRNIPNTYVEATILEGPDTDAQDVQNVRANEMAFRHRECVSDNLEWKASESDNQSASRWGKK